MPTSAKASENGFGGPTREKKIPRLLFHKCWKQGTYRALYSGRCVQRELWHQRLAGRQAAPGSKTKSLSGLPRGRQAALGPARYFSGDAINWKIARSIKRALYACSVCRRDFHLS